MGFRIQKWQAEFPKSCQGGAVSFGNFDGVHLGHQALANSLVDEARGVNGPPVAIIFYPHPRLLLQPDAELKLLTIPEDRAYHLERLGIAEVVALQVDRDFLDLEAESFFTRLVQAGLKARCIVEGPNFYFGKGRGGDIRLLEKLGRDNSIGVRIVQPVLDQEGEVSSSRIRQALETGEVDQAANLLGRAYSVRGRVELGCQRGRTIGFPTANLGGIQTVIPGYGVYAARAHTQALGSYTAAIHVGPIPTFGDGNPKVEAHLLHFSGDLYDQIIRLDFLKKIRDVRPFPQVEQLIRQLTIDIRLVESLALNEFPNEARLA